jgi:ABC-type lipoprotein export system ATPase subunit
MVALLGPSGSGKTVLLNLISGLERPDRGRVLVEGQDLGRMTARQLTAYRRRTIGFVFQGFNLVPNLSALENIMLPLEFAGVPERESRRRAWELLAAVGLTARASHTPARLSGGEQQRVAIARALANDPPIVLADDPIGNLDSRLGGEIIGILRQMADRGKTVVVAGHHVAIEEAADEVVYFRDGRIERVWNVRAAQRVSESGRGGNRP